MKKSTRFKDLTNDQKRNILQSISYLPRHKKTYFPSIKAQEQEEMRQQFCNLIEKMKYFSQKYKGRAPIIIKQCVKSLQEQVDGKKAEHQSLHRSYEYYHRQIFSLNSSFSQLDDYTMLETQVPKTRKLDLRKIESRKLIEKPKPINANSSSIKEYKNEISNLKEMVENKNKMISNYNSEMATLKASLQEIQNKLQVSNEKLLLALEQSCSLANINSDLSGQLQNMKKKQGESRLKYLEQLKCKEIKIVEVKEYLQIREQEIKTFWLAQLQRPLHIC